jgi:hypothetical protein
MVIDDRFLLSQLTQFAKKGGSAPPGRPQGSPPHIHTAPALTKIRISLTLVFDHLWIAGQILVNLQEQAAQHNSFLHTQPLGNALLYVGPDVTHGALAPVSLLCQVHP